MTQTPVQRVVLLGASNLTLAWSVISRALQQGLPGPLAVHGAFGMGRSYADWSRFGSRSLPGILNCALWQNLNQQGTNGPAPVALITDIGNDILYRRAPQEIVQRVQECIERLLVWDSRTRIVLTELPVESIEDLTSIRFRLARMVLFPRSGLQLQPVQESATRLNGMLRAIAETTNVTLVAPERHWYGFDPIHVRRRYRLDAFRSYFSEWTGFGLNTGEKPVIRVAHPVAHERIVLGRRRVCPQPCYDSDRISVYCY